MVRSLMFGLLGPVELWVDNVETPLGGPHNRAALAALLLQRGRAVGIDELIRAIWEDGPPASSRTQAQNRVSTLRQILRRSGVDRELIEMKGGGYVVTVSPEQCDLDMFEREVREADELAAKASLHSAIDAYQAALSWWRGPALGDFGTAPLKAAARRLDESRIEVLIRRIELEIRVGMFHSAIGELIQLREENPWREELVAHLMVALYKANRQGEALESYERFRRELADELGVDPGPALSELHKRILRNDPLLWEENREPPNRVGAKKVDSARRSRDQAIVPRQVPGDLSTFVGREKEVMRLDRLVRDVDAFSPVTNVFVIHGMAGAGKTALAVHWAHRVSASFLDGQIYLNLRGFDPAGTPMSVVEALRGVFDALEVPVWRIPTSLDSQIGLYRTLMAGRRMLVVLDNARDAEQVRPLLPGSSTCVTLVTSRDMLSSLTTREGAHGLALEALSLDESRALLDARIGGGRVRAEPGAANDIAIRCAQLPLALAVVSARAAYHPQHSLASLAGDLGTADGGLGVFDDRPITAGMRAVFSWSYHTLTPQAADLFRILASHLGQDIGIAAAATAVGRPLTEVWPSLTELVHRSMLFQRGPDRFYFHDLLRAYAAELSSGRENEETHAPIAYRLLSYYLHNAHVAANVINRHRHPIAPAAVTSDLRTVAQHDFQDWDDAWAWFSAEESALPAAVTRAAQDGLGMHAWRLVWMIADFFDRRGRWHDLAIAAQTALEVAVRTGDLPGQAHSHSAVARAYARLGRYDDALNGLMTALGLFSQLDDRLYQAYVHRGLAGVLEWQGRNTESLRHDEEAVELYRREGNVPGEASALNSMGWSHAQIGAYDKALTCCRRALALHRETHNPHGEASALDSLGYVYHSIGDNSSAVALYSQSLGLLREVGDRYYEADTLDHLGDALHAAGDSKAADDAWRMSLEIFNELDHPRAEALLAKFRR